MTTGRPHGISLLVPTQNVELTIELCLRSFAEYPDEIIVVDNGSTDSTIDIVRELEKEYDHLTFYDKPDLPDLHHNRQFALTKSRFSWISRIDSDYVAYTPGESDIRNLRNLVLSTPYTDPPTAFSIRHFAITRDFDTVGLDRQIIPEGRAKYVQGGWNELSARIIQHFDGMEFMRVNKRWEGVTNQTGLNHRKLDRAYWMHCDFKQPIDCLFRSERTNWREHGDFETYPTLETYLRSTIGEKYGTNDLEEAVTRYMTEEFDPWVTRYDPATMPPYPEIVTLAASGTAKLVSRDIISAILPTTTPANVSEAHHEPPLGA